MIRLGLRLMLGGGKQDVVRLVATGMAVAVGVCLLLITLAGMNAVHAQNERYGWLNTGGPGAPPVSADAGSETTSADVAASQDGDGSASDPLWWRVQDDRYDGETIVRVDVAATGPSSPVPPGIPELPSPGEFYASPELGELLGSTPAAELGDRFSGRQVGTIDDSVLPAPDSLVVVVGRSAEELSQMSDAAQFSSAEGCAGCGHYGLDSAAIDLVLVVVAGAMLFPVLIFIGTATRLAAARRERRFAAMRLVGATPRQVSVISAVEATLVAVVGVAAAFAGFALLRPSLASVSFTGERFFPEDLSLGPLQILLVVLGVPLAAAVASRLALHRVQISPLGVSRRVTPSSPRARRLIPLLAGVGELTAVVIVGRPETTGEQIVAYVPGFLLAMVGLLVAGPWFTKVGSRLMARRARRPAGLIAGRRLWDNPKAGFRAISGLVIALFVASVAVGIITTIADERGVPEHSGDVADSTLLAWTSDPKAPTTTRSEATLAGLRSLDGVTGVVPIHVEHVGPDGAPEGFVSCAELARSSLPGSCRDGAEVASIPLGGRAIFDRPDAVLETADVSLERLQELPIDTIAVTTDGASSTVEEARTAFELALPDFIPPATAAELDAESTRTLAGWRQLANVVIVASLAMAGCSLAVSVAAGLLDRKRPFSLLRLTGVPLGVLRRVVALESAVPLLLVAAVSTATGFLTAHLFLRVQLDYSLHPPGAEYYLVVLGGLTASLAIIGSTLPLLERITGPETARNE